jgi:hypothetical protein
MILSKNAENNRERFDDYRGLLRDPSEEKKTLVVDAVLSPTPRACRSCGSTVVDGNGKAIIVKNGKKETIVRFEQYNHMPLVMRLKSNAIPVKLSHPLDGSKLFCPTQTFNRKSC